MEWVRAGARGKIQCPIVRDNAESWILYEEDSNVMPMRTPRTPINADRGAGGSGYLVEDRRATARQRSRHRDVGAELRQVGLRSGKHASKKDGDVQAAPKASSTYS